MSYPKYTYLGTEGHGKKLHHPEKDQAIAISDDDGHTDYILAAPWSEEDAVQSYFRLWQESNRRLDFWPVLRGERGNYWIEKEGN